MMPKSDGIYESDIHHVRFKRACIRCEAESDCLTFLFSSLHSSRYDALAKRILTSWLLGPTDIISRFTCHAKVTPTYLTLQGSKKQRSAVATINVSSITKPPGSSSTLRSAC
ncbi:hypothetical protein HBI38_190980 [Parastagonospora nodorum]|nr:hypothetical protein HBH43_010550 [Parastagonospora nodorum]KAH4922217.1 hypothetical protein HBI79_178870 [Parastagonospora nodorum]KAH5050941.1 hypothetical protein HBH96_178600 [Parastagonospora nodorum]KAH5145491.1 hypothetical protein HBH69_181980 [Parastagonospora nodorum]KAH5172405.1 hypothetical protein HBH77_217770 [Parastagonospora nodorum]